MARDSHFDHVLKTPVHFTEQYIKEFLKDSSFLFSIKNPLRNFLFDATNTKKISLMGLDGSHSHDNPMCKYHIWYII